MLPHLNAVAPEDLDLHRFSNMTEAEYSSRVAAGVRYVYYRYTISLLVVSIVHPTRVRVVHGRRQAFLQGLPCTALTLLLGWWSFPHGPINTITCLITNLRGGVDVGPDVLEFIRQQDPKWQYGFR